MSYRVITAKLVARTVVHIGGGEGNAVTDAPLRKDAQGRPFIPGTAIAGALRSLLTRLAPRLGGQECVALQSGDQGGRKQPCSCLVCRLFGDINPSDERGSQSTASRLSIFNALPMGDFPRPWIRDAVGIDRATGAAAGASGVKFDLEVLPAGAQFELRLELSAVSPEEERLLAAGLAEWREGRVWLGGRIARGLGAFQLTDLEYRTRALDTAEELLEFLKDDEPWENAREQPHWLDQRLKEVQAVPRKKNATEAVSRGWVAIDGTLKAQDLLLCADATVAVATGFDRAPLLAQWDHWSCPVLPGSAVRGVLRAHAERLARTLATLNALDQSGHDPKDYFLAHCPACDPNAREEGSYGLECCTSLVKRAQDTDRIECGYPVPEEHFCLACRLFGSTHYGSRLIVEDAPLVTKEPAFKMLDFLAVDRFTGGGAKERKFDALTLYQPAFKIHIFLDHPEEWELGWLYLVLRDLVEGWLSVGSGAAKGLGRLKLEEWSLTFGYLTPEDLPLLVPPGSGEDRSGVYRTVRVSPASAEWRAAVDRWTRAFLGKVAGLKRDAIFPTEDTYFGRVDDLYPAGGG